MVQNYTKIMNNTTFWLYFFYLTKKKLVEDTEFPCGKHNAQLSMSSNALAFTLFL